MRLDERDHSSLVLWAADCAERVLPHFEDSYPKDNRPRSAIEAGRGWVRGEIATGEARTATFAAHAARDADGDVARAAARAATDAAVPADAAAVTARERDWQYRRLPEHLRPVAFPARGNA